MIIIGAGMAGLLAGAVNQRATIFEAGDKLPENHKAVFRLRSDAIGHFLGVPFKKVRVHKAVWFEGQEWQITPRLANLYSQKVTGRILQRSVLSVEPVTRYVPPSNFLQLLERACEGRIRYQHRVEYIKKDLIEFGERIDMPIDGEPIISTIPMPILRHVMRLNTIDFDVQRIYVNHFTIPNCDTHQTIYYPELGTSVYRATIDKNLLITEGIMPMLEKDLREVCSSFGIALTTFDGITNEVHKTPKIIPIDEETRQNMIYTMSNLRGVYSLGRYATWRPGLLLDDVFNDVFVINRLIAQNPYATAKYQQGDQNETDS